MPTTILVTGLMVFFAHFLSLQFRKTNILYVLVLMLLGILLGPVLGIVTPHDLGKVGPVIAAIALVIGTLMIAIGPPIAVFAFHVAGESGGINEHLNDTVKTEVPQASRRLP